MSECLRRNPAWRRSTAVAPQWVRSSKLRAELLEAFVKAGLPRLTRAEMQAFAFHRRVVDAALCARGACHRARIRATRWIAMTIVERQARQIDPTGKSPNLSSPRAKNIALSPSGKSVI